MYAFLGRTRIRRYKRSWTIVMLLMLFIVSILLVIIGVDYIETTWSIDTKTSTIRYTGISWTLLFTVVWAVLCLAAHCVAIYVTRRKRLEQASFRYTSQVFQQTLVTDLAAHSTDVARMAAGTAQTVADTALGAVTGATAPPSKLGPAGTSSGAETVEASSHSGRSGGASSSGRPEQASRQEKQGRPNEGDRDAGSFNTNPLIENPAQPAIGTTMDAGGGDDEDGYPGVNDDHDDDDDGYEVPSYATLCRRRLCQGCGCCGGCDRSGRPKYPKEEEDEEDAGASPASTAGAGAAPKMERSSPPRWWRAVNLLKGFLWYCVSFLAVYLTVVNIGATAQQATVSASLNDAFAVLYPPHYQTGPMCAWDEAGPDGTIKTFDTLAEVEAAGYRLIHCGACGECSNWNDLRLQWTTRTFLSKVSKSCAQKSLFGSTEDVQECNEELIGFTPGCAECWTVDELCASKNCFWIYLQSVFIDAVADFRVGLDDITSATCDEALCGPVFVPCSGATRRRMNIKSDIERPLYQQCTPVQEDWSVIFNHP
jgi:hypothetical protein